MDFENIKSWVSQPDVCRCCLSASGTLDLTASYISENGVKEIFCDVIQECFGISLSCLLEWGPSRLVCEVCVGHLRDAAGFKKQVQQAEMHFMQHCSQRESIAEEYPVKLEHCSPGPGSDAETPAHDALETHTENETELVKNSYNRKRRKHIRNKCETRTEDADRELVAISSPGNNELSALGNKGENDVDVNLTYNIEKLSKVATNKSKQVSERKRVILTCDVILKNTTACPFRHHKSWFQCFFCQQDFMQLNALRTHTNETHPDLDAELKKIKHYPRSLQIDISKFECRHCDLNLTDVEAMRRHLESVHAKVFYNECVADYKVNGSPYTCHLCKMEFHVFRTLTTHLNEHYANCICDVCGKSFLNSKRLKVHKRTHESGNFPCGECGKVLKTKTSKANHMEKHSKRIIKCQICFEPMKHYNDRIKHMSLVHNITHKFKCPYCGREYNIKHYLATHIRQTHGHKNKKCLECGMAFITNHGLKKHMQKHTGEKPFACNVCCKAYARRYTLREHMRAHEGERFQ